MAEAEKHLGHTNTSMRASDVSQGDRDVNFTGSRTYDRSLSLKIDRRLLVPFVLLNFLSLMGRTNIGAAVIQKLPQDLHLNAMQIFLVIAIPVVPLIVLEIPSNILMRSLESRYKFSYMAYLSIITILLGQFLDNTAFSRQKVSCLTDVLQVS
jgi:nitrate/nitrite transporter NarK